MLADQTLASLKRFNSNQAYQIELTVYLNMTERMIIADRKMEDWQLSLEIEKIFRKNATLRVTLCANIGEKLKHYEILIKIREAIFPNESEGAKKADKLLQDFKKLVSKEFYKTVKDSVALYSVGEIFHMTKSQFQTLCGKHMRELREVQDISTSDMAKHLGEEFSEKYVNTLERGEAPFDAYVLFKIADRLVIIVDEFIKGINLNSKKEEALIRLSKVAKGIDENLINKVADMLEGMKQNMEMEIEVTKQRQNLKTRFETSDD